MVSGNEPVDSFFKSFQLVKNAFAPIESGFRKAAKDFEHCWPGSKYGANKIELDVGQVNVIGDRKKTLCQCVNSDDRKKGLSIKVPLKTFLGMFSQNCGKSGHDALKKGVKERDNVKEDATCMNCLQFAVSWSLLLNSFGQSFPTLFKNAKKRFQKSSNGSKDCQHLLVSSSKLRVICGIMQKEPKGQLVVGFHDGGTENKEGKNMSLECCIALLFDQLVRSLQKFDLGVQEIQCSNCYSVPVSPPTNKFDHLKTITAILEGKRADVSGFLGNLKFARVGGVPSSIVRVTDPEKEEVDSGISTSSQEESGGNLPQKLANGLLSIPLSNVERLRSTLSTVSLTELIELVPQLGGRASKDHPDKKKLFSVQDFFRYTEAEGF